MYGKSSLVFSTLNSDILYSVKGRQGLQHFIYTNIILAVKVLHMKPLNLEQKIVYRYTSYLCHFVFDCVTGISQTFIETRLAL